MEKPAIIGGTFDPLHDGHKALFRKAFELSDNVFVGLTSDEFARGERSRQVTDFGKRKLQLVLYLKKAFVGKRFEIHKLDEIYNEPMTKSIREGYLVVSEGTKEIGIKINQRRKKNGVAALEIVSVPYVLTADGMPIMATRITEGDIDKSGSLLKRVHVAVGTTNRVKLDAVRKGFKQLFGEVVVKGFEVDSEVADQPRGKYTITGARNRAMNAVTVSAEKFRPHFAVGLEAGLFRVPSIKKFMDVQYCAIVDRGGNFTYGHSPGFYYPSSFDDRIKSGITIEDIIDEFFDIKNIGEKNGAIGFLTDNLVTRKDLLLTAVNMALVPRMKRELY